MAEKSSDPRWALPGFTIQTDPRSRYFDPYDKVRPPMPPDDPASHQFMRCVDGKRGWPCWYVDGFRTRLDNPNWRGRLGEYVELTGDGAIKLSLESAVRLAYVNSPDYQNQLETLYLSALDVSAERFRFDVQFFGGEDVTFTHQGRLRDPMRGETNTLQADTDLELRRRLATAGELLVGFANSLVWQFAGPDTNFTTSLVNLSLVQPLLRGAGRDVALEQLTIAERTLLSNLRAFQRYRQGFYTQAAVGDLGVSGPQRRGGFLGGTGLTGFTGTGAGGFGGVGGATGFGRAGVAGGGGAGQVGGFVGLLQQLQQIRNAQENLELQLRNLGLLEAHYEAGNIELTQVDQFRQSIETQRAGLLQAKNALENSLDTYKTGTLGLPPDLPIVLDETLIRPFQSVEPEISSLQVRVAAFREAFGEEPLEPEPAALQEALDRVTQLRNDVGQQIAAIEPELRRFISEIETRLRTVDPGQAKQFQQEVKRWVEGFTDLKDRFAKTGNSLEQLRRLLAPDRLAPKTRRHAADQLVILIGELALSVDELTLVQARTRLEKVTVEPVVLSPEEALNIARANRLDWMNNRAALVDTWRLIQFNADALQSNLEVRFEGDLGTVGNNPLKFRGPAGTLRAGLQFDAPFTRLLERNDFRQALIEYQRDRRGLIQFEDSVHQSLRGLLRTLEEHRVNLEIQRRAVAIAIRRVDETRERLLEPPPPGEGAVGLGPTAALDLLTALDALRNSQNAFMSVWLNYYAARMRLMRELGIMEIDQQGMWIDRLPVSAERMEAEGLPLPPPVPDRLFEALQPEGPAESPTLRILPQRATAKSVRVPPGVNSELFGPPGPPRLQRASFQF